MDLDFEVVLNGRKKTSCVAKNTVRRDLDIWGHSRDETSYFIAKKYCRSEVKVKDK